MKPAFIVSHAAVFCAAWFLAASLGGNDKTSAGPAASSKSSSSKSGSGPVTGQLAKPSPKVLLKALATTPMEAHERSALKDALLREWASNDPLGLFAYLEDRPWPSRPGYLGDYGISAAFEELARRHPDQLLAWARRHGSGIALHYLARDGHPPEILALFLAQERGSIPPGAFGTLFHEGQLMIPDFHRHLPKLHDPAARTEAFDGIAAILIDTRRYDDYFALIAKLQDELDPTPVSAQLARFLANTGENPLLLDRLPADFRNAAIEVLLAETPSHSPFEVSISESFRRDLLGYLHDREFLSDDLVSQAAKLIAAEEHTYHFDGSDEVEARAWRDWALGLPVDDRYAALQEAAVRRWARRDGNLEAIEQLPTTRLRDIAYAYAVEQVNLEAQPGMLEEMVNRIDDPDLRNLATRAAARIRSSPPEVRNDPFFTPFEP